MLRTPLRLSPMLFESLTRLAKTPSTAWVFEDRAYESARIVSACFHLLLLEKGNAFPHERRQELIFNSLSDPGRSPCQFQSSSFSGATVLRETARSPQETPLAERKKLGEDEERKSSSCLSQEEQLGLAPSSPEDLEGLSFIHIQRLAESLLSLCFKRQCAGSPGAVSPALTKKKMTVYEAVSSSSSAATSRPNYLQRERSETALGQSSRIPPKLGEPSSSSLSRSSFFRLHQEDDPWEFETSRSEGTHAATASSPLPSLDFDLSRLRLLCRVLTIDRIIPLIQQDTSPMVRSGRERGASLSLDSPSSSPPPTFLSLCCLATPDCQDSRTSLTSDDRGRGRSPLRGDGELMREEEDLREDTHSTNNAGLEGERNPGETKWRRGRTSHGNGSHGCFERKGHEDMEGGLAKDLLETAISEGTSLTGRETPGREIRMAV